MAKEGRERRELGIVVAGLEVASGADQFLKVFYPRLALFTFFFLVIDDQAGLFDGDLGHAVQRQVRDLGGHALDQFDERTQGAGGPSFKSLGSE
ncbi:hypothetical protein D3C76_892290 [compost metagenome]